MLPFEEVINMKKEGVVFQGSPQNPVSFLHSPHISKWTAHFQTAQKLHVARGHRENSTAFKNAFLFLFLFRGDSVLICTSRPPKRKLCKPVSRDIGKLMHWTSPRSSCPIYTWLVDGSTQLFL